MTAEVKGSRERGVSLSAQDVSMCSPPFWLLQFIGWSAYALVVFLAVIRPQFTDPDFNLSGQLLNLGIEILSGFLLSCLQWQFIRRIVHLRLALSLCLSFVSAALLGLLYNVIKLSCYKVIVYHQRWNEAWNMLEFGGWLLFSLTTLFVWTAIFFVILDNIKLQKGHELLLTAQTAAKEAQLQMLRYQLNPHFMFNTMNAISTLIYKQENDKANDMLDKLCDFFRYTLDKKLEQSTTLKNELSLLELYLSIEKVRFGERLTVCMQICPSVLAAKVPSMLLQPLVENAIKHAIEPRTCPGSISIKAEKQSGRLQLQILDDGDRQHKLARKEGLGIGLCNTKSRLNAMFNGDYSLTITQQLTPHQSNFNQAQGTAVILSTPFNE